MGEEFYNSNVYKLLKQEQEEINKLKWIESQKANRDIGKHKAVFIWVRYHRSNWLQSLKKH